ncbi:MAG: GNVR domain-containing protein, partial [Gemmatimonadaceae bacterium]
VAIWTLTATPRYKSTATLRIASSASAASPLLDQLQSVPGIGLMGLGRDELETEIGILRSRRISETVLDSLALMVRIAKPAGVRDSILTAHATGPSDVEGTLKFVRATDGRFQVTAEKLTGAELGTSTVAAGDSLRIGPIVLRLDAALAKSKLAAFDVQLLPRFKALKRFDDLLDIRQQEGGSRLVEVAYQDNDRVQAARAVARVVHEYVAYTNANDTSDDQFRAAELGHAVDSVSKALAKSEERLKSYKENQKILIPDEQASLQLKRISLARTTLDALEVEHNALSRMLALIEKRSEGGRTPQAYRQLATFPSLIANKAIQDYLANLVELENTRSELGLRRTADNDEIKQVTARITELEQQLNRVGTQYEESLEQQISVATASVKDMTSDLDVFPRQEMEYVRLLRDRTIANEAFIILQKQLKQAELSTALRTEKVRVVDSARVANAKDVEFPKTLVQLVLGAILGIAVGLTLAFGREILAGTSDHASTRMNQNSGSESAP